MAGFETIVRPVVFPDIRPTAKQSLPPQNDPEKGFAVIKGNPAKVIGLSDSFSVSSSYSRPTETERRVDEVRVYQKDDTGAVNKANFVDIEVANRITTNEGGGTAPGDPPKPPPGLIWNRVSEQEKVTYYKAVEEWENIQIMKKNKIIKNEGEGGSGP